MKNIVKNRYINIYPQHDGKSQQIKVPNWIFSISFWFLMMILVTVAYLNFAQVRLFYLSYIESKSNEKMKKEIVISSEILKDYSVNFSKNQKYIEKDLANFSIDSMPQLRKKTSKNIFTRGIGGEGKQIRDPKLIDSYSENIIDNKKIAFKEKTDISQIIDSDILSMNGSLGLIKDFNTELGERKNMIVSFPILWPIKGGKGELLKVDSKGKDMLVQLKNSEEVIATARGKVKEITLLANGRYNITIKHGFGFNTYYMGVRNIKVKLDDLVEKSKIIASAYDVFNYRIKMASKYVDPSKFAIIKY